jgi:hypothetical protein
LIPAAYVQAWSAKAPWPDARQVEQDLIICRVLCDLFNATVLKGKIAFRGGTAINKLLFKQPGFRAGAFLVIRQEGIRRFCHEHAQSQGQAIRRSDHI